MDVFAGGSSQIKDVQETDRNSHNDARRNDQQAQTMRTSDGPATPLPSKFKQRGSLNEKVQPKPVNPYQALSYNVQSKSKKLPEHRQPSPPVPTPPSSGEQMPPPPIASQRLAGAKSKAPRRSTSSGSSKTAHSDSDKAAREPARTKSKSTEKPTRASSSNKQPQDSRRSKQDQQLKEQPQADLLPSPPPQKQQSNREQHAEKREGSKGSEEDEETQLILTEDPLPSSPAVGSYEGAGEEELIMSGDGTPSRERDEDSDESSASDEDDEEEEEDEVLLAGGTQTKRKREYDEFEEDGGYKRRDMGHRSQTPDQSFEDYRGPDSYTQDDASMTFDQGLEGRFSSTLAQLQQHEFSPEEQYQHHTYQSHDHFSPPQAQIDPLASVPDLFPGANPFLQQAQARLHAQHGVIGVESRWESCTLEEWKQGGEEMSTRFAALMGRVVQLVAKKSARTEGFKQQMKQHRDELQQHQTKLEGTKQGLSDWASRVGL